MHFDVVDLDAFYGKTRLGRIARSAIRARMHELWPDTRGMNVLGFGFAVPLLGPHLDAAHRVTALMPGRQGVKRWPAGRPNVSVLCEETLWPVETDSVDRLIVLHGLEASGHPIALLDECYRVLAPEGRGILVVPNRAGLWSSRDATPFGFGRPYTLGQLEGMLSAIGLVPKRHLAALYQPPSEKRFWLRTGPFWERLGARVANRFAGGVLLVEVAKQVPAPPRAGLAEAIRRPLSVLDGIAVPGPKPV